MEARNCCMCAFIWCLSYVATYRYMTISSIGSDCDSAAAPIKLRFFNIRLMPRAIVRAFFLEMRLHHFLLFGRSKFSLDLCLHGTDLQMAWSVPECCFNVLRICFETVSIQSSPNAAIAPQLRCMYHSISSGRPEHLPLSWEG